MRLMHILICLKKTVHDIITDELKRVVWRNVASLKNEEFDIKLFPNKFLLMLLFETKIKKQSEGTNHNYG